MRARRPGAGFRQRRVIGVFLRTSPSGIRLLRPRLACFQGDGLGGSAGFRVQGSGGGVVGERYLLLAQLAGHVLGGGVVPDVDSASGAPPVLASGGLGEQQVQGG